MKKKSIAILSALAIASATAAAGIAGTVAFFQSSHQIDVVVNAAKVDVQASAPTIVSPSLQYGKVEVAQDGSIAVNLLVPGDSFLIKVSYTNLSTIGVLYKIGVTATAGLDTAIYTDEACSVPATDNVYTPLAVGGSVADHYVKVTVTDAFENGGTGNVRIGVDAVQDNFPVDGFKQYDEKKVLEVYNETGLLNLQSKLSTSSDAEYNKLDGYTIVLKQDMDLSSVANWQGMVTNRNRAFNLNFDGQGHTISNLTITNGTGFIDHFGDTGAGDGISNKIIEKNGERYQAHGNYVFKNVVFDNAHVVNQDVETGNLGAGNCAGVVTGSTLGLDLEGVTVKNSYVEAYKWVGGLAGYLTGVVEQAANPTFNYQFQHVIKDCHVENTTIKARHYRAGGFVGYANHYFGEGYLNITDSSVTGCTLEAADQGEGDRGWMVATAYNGLKGSNLKVNGIAITAGDQTVDGIKVFNPLDGSTVAIK